MGFVLACGMVEKKHQGPEAETLMGLNAPPNVAKAPAAFGNAPPNIAKAPAAFGNAPPNIAKAPAAFGNAPPNIAKALAAFGNAPPRVGRPLCGCPQAPQHCLHHAGGKYVWVQGLHKGYGWVFLPFLIK